MTRRAPYLSCVCVMQHAIVSDSVVGVALPANDECMIQDWEAHSRRESPEVGRDARQC